MGKEFNDQKFPSRPQNNFFSFLGKTICKFVMLKKRSIIFKKNWISSRVRQKREALLNTSQSFPMLSNSHDCSPKNDVLEINESEETKRWFMEKFEQDWSWINSIWEKSCSWINFYVLNLLFDLMIYSYLINIKWMHRRKVVKIQFYEFKDE
jgi:hypothetical protein